MKVCSALAVLFLWLLGCSAPVRESPPRSAAAVQTSAPEPSRPVDASAPASSSAGALEPLRELELETALALAEARHPSLEAARARIERADARRLQAGRLADPEAVLRMESAPFDGDTLGEAEYLVGARQALPLTGRLRAEERVAQAERRAAELELEAARAALRSAVRGAFATALYAERAAAARRELVRCAEGQEQLAERRARAGESAPREALLAGLAAAEARHELTRAEALAVEARRELALATGDPAQPIESVAGELEVASALPALDELLARLAEHPLLAGAEAGIVAESLRAELARAERMPDLHLDLLYRRIESDDADAFDVGIFLPLSVNARARGRVEEARARLLEARAEGELLARRIEHEARRAHERLVVARETLAHVEEEILPRVAELERIARARRAAGDVSEEELLLARARRTEAELEHLESLGDVLRAWAALLALLPEPAVGGEG